MQSPPTPPSNVLTAIGLAYDRTSNIMVVDDDDTLLKFFKIHLNKFFSKVVVVASAREAYACLAEKEIDLVLSDVRMPRVDGFQLMRKVRRHNPAIPVYLVSGAMLTADQEKLVAQADGFLKKPFGIDDLHSFLERGIRHREVLKALAELVNDPKKLGEILRGKATTKHIKDLALRAKADSILQNLKQSA